MSFVYSEYNVPEDIKEEIKQWHYEISGYRDDNNDEVYRDKYIENYVKENNLIKLEDSLGRFDKLSYYTKEKYDNVNVEDVIIFEIDGVLSHFNIVSKDICTPKFTKVINDEVKKHLIDANPTVFTNIQFN